MRSLRLLCLTSLFVYSCGPTPTPEDGGIPMVTPTARIRAVHLSPDAPAVDVFVGAAVGVSGLTFSNSSVVKEVPAGRTSLRVATASLNDVLLEADRDYTAFAFGKLNNLQLNALENDTRGLSSNNVRVRVIHAADGVGTVNVFQIPATGAPISIAPNLRYGTPALPVDLASEPITVGLDVDNDQTPDLSFDVPALPRGIYVNVFAVLDAQGNPFLLAQLVGNATAKLVPLQSQLRVLHLSPDAPGVDAYVDNAIPSAFSKVTFTKATAYASVSAGNHRLDVTASTLSMPALSVPQLALRGGKKYTAVALDRVARIRGLVIEDAAAPSGNNIAVRAIHAAPSVGAVDIFALDMDGTLTRVLDNVNFTDVSQALELSAAPHTLGVDVNEDGNPELYFEVPALPAGTVANLFVTQDAAGEVFALALLGDGTTARLDPATARVRVVHLSRNAPAVDVYANGAKVVSNLAYAGTTDALDVKAGTYTFALTTVGAAPSAAVVTAPNARLLPGRAYTAYAYGDLSNTTRPLTIGLIEDDAAGLDTNTNIRLRITHAATTVTRGDVFSVRPSGNTLLVPNIGFGETKAKLDLASNSYTVGFDAEANGTIDIAFDLPVLAPGSFANVFVATDAGGAVYLLVQTTGAGAIRVNPR
ncbi:MAG: DUF4397 domain-containing protein [Archangium sp.]